MEKTAPLIPRMRREPNLFKRQREAKLKSRSNYTSNNVWNTAEKHDILKDLWDIASKMDPNHKLADLDVLLEGKGDSSRTPKGLGLTPEQTKMLKEVAVLDSPKMDDPTVATGVVVTVYQLIERAFNAGVLEGCRKTAEVYAQEDEDISEEDNDEALIGEE